MSMTIKAKSFTCAMLIMLVLVATGILSHRYKATSNRMMNFILNLDEIMHSAHAIEVASLTGNLDPDVLDEHARKLPKLFQQLQDNFQSANASVVLTDLEISIIRFVRAANLSLPGNTLEQPLLKQLHNETNKIEQAAMGLRQATQNEIYSLRMRADGLFDFIFLFLLVGTVIAFIAIHRLFIYPILSLSRLINEVKEGVREEIPPANSNDEIGLLVDFTRETISGLRKQGKELQISRQQLQSNLQRQVAISRILNVSVISETLDELLNGTLEIILSLDWLKVQQKGGIFLVDQLDSRSLVLKSAVNFSPPILDLCARVPFGRCLCGRVAEARQTIHVTDIDSRHENRYEAMEPHGHYCVPIILGSELLGVMTFYLAPGQDKNPEEVGFLADVATILAENLARRRLAEQQKLISAAVDQAGEGVLITDIHGHIQYANPCMTQLTGYSVSELIGRKPNLFKSGKQDALFYRQMKETILSGANWEGGIINKRKDGSLFQERMVIIPVKDRAGTISNFVAIKRDITKEKALESQLVQAQKMESVGRLAGGVAHDFNNILSVIIGYSEMILDELPANSAIAEKAEIIHEIAHKAVTLTRQLLAFSRKQLLEMQILNPQDLVENMMKMLGRMIGEDIKLENRFNGSATMVRADPSQIEQVLMNLVINARDAMPRGGRLLIETVDVEFGAGVTSYHESVKPGRYSMIAISDTGVGMDQATQERIFEPFFTTKEDDKGTGLGLATVYGIVKQHNGYINVFSEPGGGATFKIYLPVVDHECSQADKQKIMPKPVGDETILVVEDDPAIGVLVIEVLQPLGYRLLTAANGKEALEISRNFAEDIPMLLTDVIMPGMNGRELAEALKKDRPTVKVIFMSGYTDDVISQCGILDGGVNFIQKPLSPNTLAVKIREVLDSA
jgi:PAS domain S-box-containing protein